VLPLRTFFAGRLPGDPEGTVSARAARRRIRELIAEEDPGSPMTDGEIARALAASGIRIARRTVVKYREVLGLPAALLRRSSGAPARRAEGGELAMAGQHGPAAGTRVAPPVRPERRGRRPAPSIAIALALIGLGLIGHAAPGGLAAPSPAMAQDLPGASPAVGAARIRMEPVGVSFTSGEEAGAHRTIYSIAIGSPERGEALATHWTPYFGMHALDGTLWVRDDADSSTRWKRVTLRRPRSSEEILRFADQPGAFEETRRGDPGILPAPFNALARSELDLLDFVVTYASGGTRALLRVGTTDGQAEAVLGALSHELRAALPR
jgi:hypothetical protein